MTAILRCVLMTSILFHSACVKSAPSTTPHPIEQNTAESSKEIQEPALKCEWLEADTEVVLQIRPSELLESPLLKLIFSGNYSYHGTLLQPEMLLVPYPLHLNEIAQLTIGVTGVFETGSESVFPDEISTLEKNLLAYVEFTNPLPENFEEFSPGWSSSEMNGKTFLTRSSSMAENPVTIYVIDSKQLLIGPFDLVQAAVQRGTGSSAKDQFAFVCAKEQLVIAFAPTDLDSVRQSILPGEHRPGMSALINVLQHNAEQASLHMQLDNHSHSHCSLYAKISNRQDFSSPRCSLRFRNRRRRSSRINIATGHLRKLHSACLRISVCNKRVDKCRYQRISWRTRSNNSLLSFPCWHSWQVFRRSFSRTIHIKSRASRRNSAT